MIRASALPAGFLFILLSCSLFSRAGAGPPGKWQTRAPLPSSRTEVAAAEIGGKIFVIGGYGKNVTWLKHTTHKKIAGSSALTAESATPCGRRGD